MIDGTRPYKGKKIAVPPTTTPAAEEAAAEARPDAVNLGRRAWFSELVPALGAGLVKILRAGNHLRDEIRERSAPGETKRVP